jgi:hypothetical protein
LATTGTALPSRRRGLAGWPFRCGDNAANGREQIDAVGSHADLEHEIGGGEVLGSQVLQGSSESYQGGPDPLSVLAGRPNPEIQVTRRPWGGVDRHRVGSDHQELCPRLGQRTLCLGEVSVHVPDLESPRLAG